MPFFKSLDAPKIFDAILLRTERGVDGKLPPKMSLLPPPGGFRTLKNTNKNEEKLVKDLQIKMISKKNKNKVQFSKIYSSSIYKFERFSISWWH